MKNKLLIFISAWLLPYGIAIAATVTYTITLPTLPYGAPGYTPNGAINVTVADTPDCTGALYLIYILPVANSGPGGVTPSIPLLAYSNWPEGNFLFNDLGYGSYTINVSTLSCVSGTPPAQVIKTADIFEPSVPALDVPALTGWEMALLSGLMMASVLIARRRRYRKNNKIF